MRYGEVVWHDKGAFCEGLAQTADGQTLYESTGQYGHSELRELDTKTGAVRRAYRLPAWQFGEGIALLERPGLLVQLTWRNRLMLVYDLTRPWWREGPAATLPWPREGWGATAHPNGRQIVVSDGTARLYILDAACLPTVVHTVVIRDGAGRPVPQLNALTSVGPLVLANVWPTPRVAVIDPAVGLVLRWLDLAPLHPPLPRWLSAHDRREAVANGLAWDAPTECLLVTGKFWPVLYRLPLPMLARLSTPTAPPAREQ